MSCDYFENILDQECTDNLLCNKLGWHSYRVVLRTVQNY